LNIGGECSLVAIARPRNFRQYNIRQWKFRQCGIFDSAEISTVRAWFFLKLSF
jgi:hypothetical protein